ncbi:MAG TPA: SAM-dependent methyltransferase [Puia sp.]|nr:SAM-dependent methyltransferase [Puia sp.]
MNTQGKVYLIPAFIDEQSVHVIPGYVVDAVRECQVFFTENQRSTRRYLKSLWKEMVIDDYEWFTIHKSEAAQKAIFLEKLKEGKTIGIVSEAGCPGVADPGQILVETAHQFGSMVRPLVGPSSILLTLMASGMNGQYFQFVGYLPIEESQKIQSIKDLEMESRKKNCTQIFIETPYRNNQLMETVIKICKPSTRFCIAANLTAAEEFVKTKTIAAWKNHLPDLHKRPAIFCLFAD